MADNTGTIAGTSYPLAAGTADTALADATVDGLLRYFAHWLNYDLNAKLANMTGVADEAVPSGSTYGYDPQAGFVRNDVPALYMWRSRMATVPGTLLGDWSRDEFTALWIFSSRELPNALAGVEGIGRAVRDSLARATQQKSHETFTPTGWPIGTDIMTAHSLLAISLDGVEAGYLMPTPGQRGSSAAAPNGGDGMRQRAYPSVQARWTVVEEVGQARTLVDPDDVTREALVTLYEDDTAILERYAVAPDGSDEV